MESLHSLLLKQNYFPFTPQSFQRKCSDLLLSNIDLDRFICDKKTPGCLFCLRLDEDSEYLATTTGLNFISKIFNFRSGMYTSKWILYAWKGKYTILSFFGYF